MADIFLIPKFIDEGLTPIAKVCGTRIAQAIDIACTFLDKLELRKKHELEQFAESLDRKFRLIPDDQLVEPSISIIGPAIESVYKYYYEEEHLKEMYANLIISAMNKNVAPTIHPSFSKVIEQLSADDALFLKSLLIPTRHKERKLQFGDHGAMFGSFPYKISVRASSNPSSSMSYSCMPIQDDFFMFKVPDRIKKLDEALENLSRLRLIDFDKASALERLENESLKTGIEASEVVQISLTDYGRRFVQTVVEYTEEEILNYCS